MTRLFFEETNLDSNSGYFDNIATLKNDAVDLPFTSRFLVISTAGNLVVVSEKGTQLTIAVPVGRADLRVTRILSTGTTAVGVVCF